MKIVITVLKKTMFQKNGLTLATFIIRCVAYDGTPLGTYTYLGTTGMCSLKINPALSYVCSS